MDDAGVREAVVLGRDGLRAGWSWTATVAALGAGAVAGWYLGHLPHVVALYGTVLLLAAAGGAVVLLRRTSHAEVSLDEEGVAVRDGRGEFRRPWDEVLEVGAGGLGRTVGVLNPEYLVLVRPEGARWATPGPNAPYPVLLPVFGRAARERARRHLEDACRRRGVPFTTDVARMQDQPRPGSVLRHDRQPPPPEDGSDDLSRG